MRSFKFIIFVLLAALVPSIDAQAQLKSKLDLENSLVSRIEKTVHIVDPSALVSVNIQLKRLEAVLPGTGLSISGSIPTRAMGGGDSAIGINDIARVEVRVSTSKKDIPDWLKPELEKSLGSTLGSRLSISIEEMPPEMAKSFDSKENSSKPESLSDLLQQLSSRWTIFFTFALVGAGIGLLIAFFTQQYFQNSRQSALLSSLKGALSSQSGPLGGFNAPPSVPKEKIADRSFFANPTSEDSVMQGSEKLFQSLSGAQLLALFSDCYWCEKDAYGAFIWSGLSNAQRTQMISSWSEAGNYAKYVATKSKRKDLGFHMHPAYITPAAELQNHSNTELKIQVKKDPSIWHQLSPMRQSALQLSLSEQLACLKSVSKTAAVFGNLTISSQREKRSFAQSANLSRPEISPAEELGIFRTPESIPAEFRSVVHSLVWLALLPLEQRKQILQDFGAEELSQGFVGCEAVLLSLREAIADSKFKLLESYIQKNPPTKTSPIFGELVGLGLSAYQESVDLMGSKREAA
jgi:hypothetical protein